MFSDSLELGERARRANASIVKMSGRGVHALRHRLRRRFQGSQRRIEESMNRDTSFRQDAGSGVDAARIRGN
jgi:hypothetical protein